MLALGLRAIIPIQGCLDPDISGVSHNYIPETTLQSYPEDNGKVCHRHRGLLWLQVPTLEGRAQNPHACSP